MTEMNEFYGMNESDLLSLSTLIVNVNNPIVSELLKQPEEKQELLINQIYYLAIIAYKKLTPDELADFTNRTTKLLLEYSKE